MDRDRPFSVLVRAATAPRRTHLEQLLRGAGYHTHPASSYDARLVDYVGARRLSQAWSTAELSAYDGLETTILVVPERLADEARTVPLAMVHVDAAGGDQALLLRVAVGCRRGRAVHDRLDALGVTLVPQRNAVRGSGGDAVLTPLEYRLLRTIVRGGGEPVTRLELTDVAWRDRPTVPDATLDSHVRGIRKKLMAAGVPLGIGTIRGVGYRCC